MYKLTSWFTPVIQTSFSEYRDFATISSSIRVSAWNSLFSQTPKILYEQN